MAVWGGLMAVLGGLVVVWWRFGVVWGVEMDRCNGPSQGLCLECSKQHGSYIGRLLLVSNLRLGSLVR